MRESGERKMMRGGERKRLVSASLLSCFSGELQKEYYYVNTLSTVTTSLILYLQLLYFVNTLSTVTTSLILYLQLLLR